MVSSRGRRPLGWERAAEISISFTVGIVVDGAIETPFGVLAPAIVELARRSQAPAASSQPRSTWAEVRHPALQSVTTARPPKMVGLAPREEALYAMGVGPSSAASIGAMASPFGLLATAPLARLSPDLRSPGKVGPSRSGRASMVTRPSPAALVVAVSA